MELVGKKVLITGGAGLVGSHIADKLINENVKEIIVLDNFTRGRKENLEWAINNGNLRIIEGDIRDKELLNKCFKDIDIVFHQAAIRITACAEKPREALEVMVNGTFNVLEAAVASGVKKIVAASSASVYGMADEFPTNEMHHLYNNRTLYGATKVANEQMFRAFNEMYGLNYIMLRYFNIYGPRMDVFGVYTEVLIRWLDCIDKGEPPLIFGDGNQSMDFVFIEDVAWANILAAKSDLSDCVFNVASGEETSLNALLETLLELMGSNLKPIHKEERKVNPVSRRLAETRKAKELLGFEAKTSLKNGLQKLINWRKKEMIDK